jgi:post-segregation antitoxin (ccd killing protein)
MTPAPPAPRSSPSQGGSGESSSRHRALRLPAQTGSVQDKHPLASKTRHSPWSVGFRDWCDGSRVVSGVGVDDVGRQQPRVADRARVGLHRTVRGFTSQRCRRIVIRMPRMQVYLPDDLYQVVKERNLPASELLQQAVRAEVRRRDLLDATDQYLAELLTEVGEPTAQETTRAQALARRLTRDAGRAAS